VKNVLHRRLVEALASEAALGGVQNLPTPPIKVLIADSWHREQYKTVIRS
jgi:hypothetical protein